ncbi:MAG: hypothetical protein ACO1RT_06975 [Planctomycetaceae bacterium]
MSRAFAFLPFVFLTVFCWGNYGPLMHHGNLAMGDALRPFIGVGFAYFLIAVVVPVLLLQIKGEKGNWSSGGIVLSLLAGAVGALGALGVIVAFSAGAKPVYVMPLVFGGAPVVNTLVTMAMGKNFEKIRPIFFIGILLAALGGAGVLFFRPGPAPAAATAAVAAAAAPVAPTAELNFPLIVTAVAGAVFSWGAYGPVLHKGQMKMGGSRLRPFLCVGIAYFVMAVAIPLLILQVLPNQGTWNSHGIGWSLAGGAAGAVGALGIIYAFNFGGKPIFVMPLIFGLAPIMNTLTTLTENNSWGRIDVKFVLALAVTILGAVTVLVTAPKPAKPASSGGSADDRPAPGDTPSGKLAST